MGLARRAGGAAFCAVRHRALTRAELWHAPRGTIAVLRPAPCPALDALHAATDVLARTAGLAPEARPYRPHPTALRHAERVQGARLPAPTAGACRQSTGLVVDLQAQPRYHRLAAFAARFRRVAAGPPGWAKAARSRPCAALGQR